MWEGGAVIQAKVDRGFLNKEGGSGEWLISYLLGGLSVSGLNNWKEGVLLLPEMGKLQVEKVKRSLMAV